MIADPKIQQLLNQLNTVIVGKSAQVVRHRGAGGLGVRLLRRCGSRLQRLCQRWWLIRPESQHHSSRHKSPDTLATLQSVFQQLDWPKGGFR